MPTYTVTADGTTYDFPTVREAEHFACVWLRDTYPAVTQAVVVAPNGGAAAVFERRWGIGSFSQLVRPATSAGTVLTNADAGATASPTAAASHPHQSAVRPVAAATARVFSARSRLRETTVTAAAPRADASSARQGVKRVQVRSVSPGARQQARSTSAAPPPSCATSSPRSRRPAACCRAPT